MVLQTSLPISLSDIAEEFGAVVPYSLTDFYRGNTFSGTAIGSTLPTVSFADKDDSGFSSTNRWDLRVGPGSTDASIDTSTWSNWENQVLRVDASSSADDTSMRELVTPTFINLRFSASITATVEVTSVAADSSDTNFFLGNIITQQGEPGANVALTISQGNYTATGGVPDFTAGRIEEQSITATGARSNIVLPGENEMITIGLSDSFNSGDPYADFAIRLTGSGGTTISTDAEWVSLRITGFAADDSGVVAATYPFPTSFSTSAISVYQIVTMGYEHANGVTLTRPEGPARGFPVNITPQWDANTRTLTIPGVGDTAQYSEVAYWTVFPVTSTNAGWIPRPSSGGTTVELDTSLNGFSEGPADYFLDLDTGGQHFPGSGGSVSIDCSSASAESGMDVAGYLNGNWRTDSGEFFSTTNNPTPTQIADEIFAEANTELRSDVTVTRSGNVITITSTDEGFTFFFGFSNDSTAFGFDGGWLNIPVFTVDGVNYPVNLTVSGNSTPPAIAGDLGAIQGVYPANANNVTALNHLKTELLAEYSGITITGPTAASGEQRIVIDTGIAENITERYDIYTHPRRDGCRTYYFHSQ